MRRELVTRRLLARRLVVDAATRPLNIAVLAGVVVAALLLDAFWLLPIAVVLYVGLVIETVFRGRAAERVGAETYAAVRRQAGERALSASLAPEIAEPLAAARAEAQRIREAVDTLEQPLPEVTDEVDELLAETDRVARRGQLVHEYLAEQDRDLIRQKLDSFRAELSTSPAAAAAIRETLSALQEHLDLINLLEQQLARLRAELEHLVSSLSIIRGQLLRAAAAEELLFDQELARQLRELRTNVGERATALQEVFSNMGA